MTTKGQGFTPWAPHHWIWGLLIATGGFICIFYLPCWLQVISWGLLIFGLWVALDDFWQHYRQRTEPEYHTLWHNWFYKGVEWAIPHTKPGSWQWRLLEWLRRV